MMRFDPHATLPKGVVVIEASAGTGKTYSITGLVLRLIIEDGIPLDSILVVTFTEAATAELRARIRARLRDAAASIADATGDGNGPITHTDEVLQSLIEQAAESGTLDEAGRRVRAALERFDTAAIHTIHGFCGRILRDYAFECGAEIDAELLESPDELLSEIIRDFWAREIASRSVDAVREVCKKDQLSLESLGSLATRAVRDPDAEIVPHVPPDASALNAAWQCVDDATRELATRVRAFAERWAKERNGLARLLEGAIDKKLLNGTKWRSAYLTSRLAKIDAWVAQPLSGVPDVLESYFTFDKIAADTKKGNVPPVHPLFDEVRLFVDAKSQLDSLARAHVRLVKHACVEFARTEFDRRKRARRLQTFDDLLRQVRDALRSAEHGAALVESIRKRFRAVLIDEFQDTDAVQWEIFRRLFAAPDRRLTLIGDPKQAIYSFRGADVYAYLDAKKDASAVYSLATNWRSDGPLVDAVNHLFTRHDQPFAVAGIGYTPVDARYDQARVTGDAAAPFRIRFFGRDGALTVDKPSDPISKGLASEHLPSRVAADIVRFLRGKAQVPGAVGPRAVSPGDCAVLVRTGNQARAIQAALRAVSVPSVLHGDESVFASDEAREVEMIMAAVLEPSKTRLCRAALATNLLGRAAADELIADGVWESATPPGPGDLIARFDADEQRLDRWVERFRLWRERWERRGFMPMLRSIMRELALPQRLLVFGDGERQLTNLLHLAELLHAESVERKLSAPALYEWLCGERSSNNSEARARAIRLESDADAVEIVTIHSSKGLEYPFVWCPYLWDGKLTHKADTDLYVREETPTGFHHIISVDAEANKEYLARVENDRFAENARLLYVALTRARHRCTVWWGPVNECVSSPLGYLLHSPTIVDASTLTEIRATAKQQILDLVKGEDSAIFAELQRIAAASAGHISVERDSDEANIVWRAADETAASLRVREWQRRAPLDDRWRVGSFTWMTRHADTHASSTLPAVDFESAPESIADAQSARSVVPPSDIDDVVHLADFPANAQAGICLHAMLDSLDFSSPESISAAARRALLASNFNADQWTDPVATAMSAVFNTPLHDGVRSFRLRDVPHASRVSELAFHFPVGGGLNAAEQPPISARDLAHAFRDHPGGAVPVDYASTLSALSFTPFRGFLTGAIDLIVEHGGRFYLLDYKSNHLGVHRSDYAPHRLVPVMANAHYILQYHLYTMALDRYLAHRVPDYDYDTHMGGVFYLFLRGVHPSSDSNSGIFFDRSPRSRIEALWRAMEARADILSSEIDTISDGLGEAVPA